VVVVRLPFEVGRPSVPGLRRPHVRGYAAEHLAPAYSRAHVLDDGNKIKAVGSYPSLQQGRKSIGAATLDNHLGRLKSDPKPHHRLQLRAYGLGVRVHRHRHHLSGGDLLLFA